MKIFNHTGNQAATGSQLGAGTEQTFFSSLIVQRCHFACRKFTLLAINGAGGVRQHTYRAPHFSCTVVAQTCFYLLSECTVAHLNPCTCMAQVTKHIVCVSPKNTYTSSRNVEHLPALDDTKHGHSFLTFSLNQSSSEPNNPAKIDGHS